jgi:RNA polymerase sigma-70 factor (TIGR02960 family)
MTADLLARAQTGDGDAFGQLIDPYRRELQVHCYRILGSVQDAEDALQETLLAAWRGLEGFEGRSSVRTWLYRVATSRCLNALRSGNRRPQSGGPLAGAGGQPAGAGGQPAGVGLPPGVSFPPPNRLGEVTWLEPYPDLLLEGLADSTPGPEARYEASEAISLAFITALQLLPPRQRAVLILRDVLGFHASEVAGMLDTTEESVTSALKRARAAVQQRRHSAQEPPLPGSAGEQAFIARLTRAYETGDIDDVVAMLTDDVLLAMPPLPLEYQGRELAARFIATVVFRQGRSYRLVPTRANGQLALAAYVAEPGTGIARANSLLVLTLAGTRIAVMTRFAETLFPRFGLPDRLPG